MGPGNDKGRLHWGSIDRRSGRVYCEIAGESAADEILLHAVTAGGLEEVS